MQSISPSPPRRTLNVKLHKNCSLWWYIIVRLIVLSIQYTSAQGMHQWILFWQINKLFNTISYAHTSIYFAVYIIIIFQTYFTFHIDNIKSLNSHIVLKGAHSFDMFIFLIRATPLATYFQLEQHIKHISNIQEYYEKNK